MTYIWKIATETWEFEQIHRLNYATFVEEIPQHHPHPEKMLVDRFHAENTYLICLDQRQLIGMVAMRDRRPFSLDRKLENLDAYLPPAQSLCEARLLAVKKAYRHRRIFYELLWMIVQYRDQRGYDLVLVSTTLRQQKLYNHLGFVPFGPLVGAPAAQYQPMYLTLDAYERCILPLYKNPHTISAS